VSTITTAAELDALPVRTILADCGGWPVWRDQIFGWCSSNGTKAIDTEMLLRDGAPLTVLYRPDSPLPESYHGRCSEVSFVREGQQPMCSQCSEDEGDPFGDYCCDCCNERGRQPGTYLTVRLDDDPPVHMGRVTVTYQENAS